MKNLVTIILALVAVGILVAAYFFFFDKPVTNQISGDEVVFTDPASDASVSVSFDQENNKAFLTGLGYQGLPLESAISASGARYVNDDENVEVWNRGNDVTISKDGDEIFVGNIGGQSDADKLDGTWNWQATTIDDQVIEPATADKFTITFNEADGKVNGTTDCNGFFGPYTVDGNALTFGPLGATLMYCEGSQENEFTSALSQTKSFFFAGSGALVLELEEGGTMLFGR